MTLRALSSASAAWIAGALAKLMQPSYKPEACSPEGERLATDLIDAYQRAVVNGYLHGRQLIKAAPKKGKKGLRKDDVRLNLEEVSVRFNKAAAKLDPDGLACELVDLFCVGVAHMDVLDNRRRVVAVWSALLAPAVVLREKDGRVITQERLYGIASEWLRDGSTAEAQVCAASADTRFIASHPARIYELMTDTAARHGIAHQDLLASVMHPVILAVGQHVGARQAAAGVLGDDIDAMMGEEEAA